MTKHIVNPHNYIHVGGGCFMGQNPLDKCADEEYRCSCGESFGVDTTKDEHISSSIPMEFISRLEGKAAAKEVRKIINQKFNGGR